MQRLLAETAKLAVSPLRRSGPLGTTRETAEAEAEAAAEVQVEAAAAEVQVEAAAAAVAAAEAEAEVGLREDLNL